MATVSDVKNILKKTSTLYRSLGVASAMTRFQRAGNVSKEMTYAEQKKFFGPKRILVSVAGAQIVEANRLILWFEFFC